MNEGHSALLVLALTPCCLGGVVNMTYTALFFSRFINGVSLRHEGRPPWGMLFASSTLEEYDIALAKYLCAGVDLWLNTPQKPQEASGTSGMKAALNGVPSLSVRDGWWIEGHVEGAPLGVKWRWKRRCLLSHLCTSGCLCVP